MTVSEDLYRLLLQNIPLSVNPPYGFLELSGATTSETAHSKVYSNFFNPAINKSVSDLFLTALNQLVEERSRKRLLFDVISVKTEMVTEDGKRIDIYIDDEVNRTAIIIENKIYHHLTNDLSSYWNQCNYPEQNKVGVILTLDCTEVPPANKSSYVNIRHVELLERVEQIGLPPGLPVNFYCYINDYIATIKYLSTTMDMSDSARFYFNHANSVNKAIDTQRAAADYINNQIQLAAGELGFQVNFSSKNYGVFTNELSHPNVFYTIVFDRLFAGRKDITIILELSGDKHKSAAILQSMLMELYPQIKLRWGTDTWKDHRHFLIDDYEVIDSDLVQLSQFIVTKIRTNFEPLARKIIEYSLN